METRPALFVIVLAPGGGAGRGGVDRQMAAVRAELAKPVYGHVHADFVASRGAGSLLLSPFFLCRALLLLVWRKFRRRVNVVHINLSVRGSAYRKIILAWVCRALGLPYVIHLHGGYFHLFYDDASPRVRRMIEKLYARASSVIVLGNIWRERVIEWSPAARDRIVIMPTSTADPGPPRFVRRDYVGILFAGRLGAGKGVPQLVSALGELNDIAGWHATLAGDGDLASTRTAVEKLDLADRVTITGWLDSEDVDALMRQSDILALPSFGENLPLSIVEAFARGVAVVSTPVGAIPEIVTNDETGLLVNSGDVPALKAALRRLVLDAPLRERLARNARSVFEDRLRLSTYTERLVDLWYGASGEQRDLRPASRLTELDPHA
jgi:glycosyltransferase involved in cell wall biosynthesis